MKQCHYGIRENILAWVKSFLSNRSQQVLVEGEMKSKAPVTSGVPQGSVLGPLLFLVYINDMPARVKSTSRLFADDSLLYRKIKSPADTQALPERTARVGTFKLRKGKALGKHSLHGKTTAQVLLKLFISGNERCRTTDDP